MTNVGAGATNTYKAQSRNMINMDLIIIIIIISGSYAVLKLYSSLTYITLGPLNLTCRPFDVESL